MLKKRILVYGMTDNRGGIESYIMNFYRHIDKEKLTFDFIIDFKEMAYEHEVTAAGSKVLKIHPKSKHPIGHLASFYKILKNHPEYDTVYFNILNASSAYSMVVPFLLRRTIIVHSHNGSNDNMKLHKVFKNLLNFFADKRLACSELAARYMFGDKYVDKGKVTVINNAICVDDFTFNPEERFNKRKELGLCDEFAVLHVGRMENQKNPMYLLDIFGELLSLEPSAVLIYVGTGSMEDEVKNRAREKGISENIKFLGMRNDVSELMQAADVFLLPSKYEGLPIVAIEAQTSDLQCFLSKNISLEAKITENVHFISIDALPSVWADEIIKFDRSERKSLNMEIEQAGYDIEKETDNLVKILS